MTEAEKYTFLQGGYKNHSDGYMKSIRLSPLQDCFLHWVKYLYINKNDGYYKNNEELLQYLTKKDIDDLGLYIGYVDYTISVGVYREIDKEVLTDLTNLIKTFRKKSKQINLSYKSKVRNIRYFEGIVNMI
jgi:hypothetical protein